MDILELKQKIELRQGDITEMEVDAVVNAANTDLILGAGVSGAIGRKGGPVIQEECDSIRSMPVGEAVPTTAGAMKAQYVIHAATMEVGHFARERDIGKATRNALRRADELKLKTIAFPAIGTGAAALAADKCARVMFDAVLRHLAGRTGIERVYLVLFDSEKHDTFRQVFESLGTADEPQDRSPRHRH